MSDDPVGRVARMTPARAHELQAGGSALVVDVREVHELMSLRAPEVILLPLTRLPIGYRDLPRDRPLLMLCRSGVRSLRAAAFLVGQGYGDVANVDGGMIAWRAAGLPVRSGPLAPGEGELHPTAVDGQR